MNLSELKQYLTSSDQPHFQLPNGDMVPAHYHVTEVGVNTREFLDCGGTHRKEQKINLQLWVDKDIDHRLKSQKLLDIIKSTARAIELSEEWEVEVEYQSDTIAKYGLLLAGGNLLLTKTQTACLALDACGVAPSKPKMRMSEMNQSCAPGSGCC